MSEVSQWVFTICSGAFICGIVSILLPSSSCKNSIRLLLGVFMLTCFVMPVTLGFDLPSIDVSQAEETRLEIAESIGETTEDIAVESYTTELQDTVYSLTQQYGIEAETVYIELVEAESGYICSVAIPIADGIDSTELQREIEIALGIETIVQGYYVGTEQEMG